MGAYLVREGEEVDCDGSSTVACQSHFLEILAGEYGCCPCETSERGRALTSYPLPASGCRGTSSPPWSSTVLSLSSHCSRPARNRSAVSMVLLHIRGIYLWGERMHRRRAWCCRGLEGPTGGDGPTRRTPQCRALALLVKNHPASRPTRLLHLPYTTDDASTTTTGCTHRRFLSLRRATVAVTPSSTNGFSLGRALHFKFYRGRVVSLSRFHFVLAWVMIVAAMQ